MDATSLDLSKLSPVQMELMDVLGEQGLDERTGARKMSVDLSEFRALVSNLARKLDLPPQDTSAHELAQLAQVSRQVANNSNGQNGASRKWGGVDPATTNRTKLAAWQELLIRVGAAIAAGQYISVDPYRLRPMVGQPRDYFPKDEQKSLEDSLGLMGQVQDIIIRKKAPPRQSVSNAPQFVSEDRVWKMSETEFEICDGERRWRGVMEKGIPLIRAKLIEIDDEGAYHVAGVSNFNRVGHTVLERARHIKRLLNGTPAFPLEIIASLQGISKATAEKLLDTLKLPSDIHEMMNPRIQKERGHEVLGKVASYEIARLASNPVLHEHARDLARKSVRREIKLPQIREEVDRILMRVSGSAERIAERHQPARRLSLVEAKLTVAVDAMKEIKSRLDALKDEGVLPEKAKLLKADLNNIIDMSEAALKIIGVERENS